MESESFVGSLENSISVRRNDKVIMTTTAREQERVKQIQWETTMIHKFVLCIYAPEETKVGKHLNFALSRMKRIFHPKAESFCFPPLLTS